MFRHHTLGQALLPRGQSESSAGNVSIESSSSPKPGVDLAGHSVPAGHVGDLRRRGSRTLPCSAVPPVRAPPTSAAFLGIRGRDLPQERRWLAYFQRMRSPKRAKAPGAIEIEESECRQNGIAACPTIEAAGPVLVRILPCIWVSPSYAVQALGRERLKVTPNVVLPPLDQYTVAVRFLAKCQVPDPPVVEGVQPLSVATNTVPLRLAQVVGGGGDSLPNADPGSAISHVPIIRNSAIVAGRTTRTHLMRASLQPARKRRVQ
jgi:hypothetical protein